MKQKIFYPTTEYYKKRPILVRVDNKTNTVSFHFHKEDDRAFYWFKSYDWDRDFEQHLYKKGWFSPAMKEFLNKNIAL
jgi:hypothetical protein